MTDITITPTMPGQIWKHVGMFGVPGTGLLVRVVSWTDKGWLCDYPDTPTHGQVIYKAQHPFVEGYELLSRAGQP